MSRLLLDSHVVVWMLADSPRLGPSARAAIVAAEQVCVSVVSPWELAIKRALGRLDMPDDLVDLLDQRGATWLAIEPADGLAAAALPRLHGDPFDRMLVAQAIRASLTIMTADPAIGAYAAPVVDASN